MRLCSVCGGAGEDPGPRHLCGALERYEIHVRTCVDSMLIRSGVFFEDVEG